MIPMKGLPLEKNIGNRCKHSQTDTFLYHLELHQVEGTAIALKTHTVGGYLTAILKKGDTPTKGNHT